MSDDSAVSFGGLWDALQAHLDPAAYRPVRAAGVTTVPLMTRRGQPYYILANRRHASYLRLTPEDYYLWTLMDGARSIKDLLFEYFTKFGALAFDVFDRTTCLPTRLGISTPRSAGCWRRDEAGPWRAHSGRR